MATWGVRPTDSDSALDWLGEVNALLIEAIRKALQAFLDEPLGRYQEAEVAAALLVDCAIGRRSLPYQTLDLVCVPELEQSVEMALTVVDRMLASRWLDDWGESADAKRAVLLGLRADLEDVLGEMPHSPQDFDGRS